MQGGGAAWNANQNHREAGQSHGYQRQPALPSSQASQHGPSQQRSAMSSGVGRVNSDAAASQVFPRPSASASARHLTTPVGKGDTWSQLHTPTTIGQQGSLATRVAQPSPTAAAGWSQEEDDIWARTNTPDHSNKAGFAASGNDKPTPRRSLSLKKPAAAATQVSTAQTGFSAVATPISHAESEVQPSSEAATGNLLFTFTQSGPVPRSVRDQPVFLSQSVVNTRQDHSSTSQPARIVPVFKPKAPSSGSKTSKSGTTAGAGLASQGMAGQGEGGKIVPAFKAKATKPTTNPKILNTRPAAATLHKPPMAASNKPAHLTAATSTTPSFTPALSSPKVSSSTDELGVGDSNPRPQPLFATPKAPVFHAKKPQFTPKGTPQFTPKGTPLRSPGVGKTALTSPSVTKATPGSRSTGSAGSKTPIAKKIKAKMDAADTGTVHVCGCGGMGEWAGVGEAVDW